MTKLLDKLAELGEKYLSGHITIGPVTLFGFNAMHGQAEINTRRFGVICIKPPTYMFGRWWPAQFYMSPNHTPWASTFLVGKRFTRLEKIAAFRRWALWGHGYSTEQHDPHKENEFFEEYLADVTLTDDEHCEACEELLTTREATYSNVCLKCMIKEFARHFGAPIPENGEAVEMKFKGGKGIPWGEVTQ